MSYLVFFFQAEDGIRDLVRSRGLGDVYKRQAQTSPSMRGIKGESAFTLVELLVSISLAIVLMTSISLFVTD